MGDIIDDVTARLVQRIESPTDLLLFKLGSALKMENRLLWTLDALASEAKSIEIKDEFHHHVEETRSHIASVRRGLTALGATIDDEQPSPPVEGMSKDTGSNAKHASEELEEPEILSGAAEIEHHEIAVYETLIALADAVGRRDVAEVLRPVLEQEHTQLSQVDDAFQKAVEELDLEEGEPDDLLHRVKSKVPHMIQSPRDALEFNLGVALNMEQTILTMLGELEEHAQGGHLTHRLHDHAEETTGHIDNLQRAFAALDAKPQKQPCRAIKALQKEAKTNLKLTRDGMFDAVILSAAAETEHYEIAVYDALITLAESLGADDLLPPLRENLTQERQMLQDVSKAMETEARAHARSAG